MDENKKKDICGDSAKESRTASENNSDDSENGSTLKIILLVLSLLLWGYLIYIGMKNGITTSIHRGQLDLYSFVHPIGDFWFDIVLREYILFAFLLIAVALYPIFFIMDKRSKKKESKRDSGTSVSANENSPNSDNSESETLNRNKAIDNLMEYMDEAERESRFKRFSLSFIPYLYILWSGVFGFKFGGYVFGFQGMGLAAAILSLVPVYPILLVAQIMSYVHYVDSGKFGDEQRRGTAKIVTILICAALVIGIGHIIIDSADDPKEENSDMKRVEVYLSRKYGEYAEDMEIVECNDGAYKIETPLLENSCFYVHMYDGKVYDGTAQGEDGFKDVFREEYNITEVISDYMCYTYMSTYNCDFEITLYDYDFKRFLDYGCSRDFVKSCEFKVDYVSLYFNEYKRESLLKAAESLCVKYNYSLPKFRGKITEIRIYIDDEWVYDVDMDNRIEIDEKLELDVSTVNDTPKLYEKILYDFPTSEAIVTPVDSEEFTIQLFPHRKY